LIILEAVFNNIHLFNLFHVEELLDQFRSGDLLEGEVIGVRVLTVEFGALELLVADLDLFCQSLADHLLRDLELFLHACVA
jgi:hypothetical protein